MMNEWGLPPVHLHSLLYSYAKKLADKGQHLPAIAVAGGFAFEDQIFKGMAMGAPFVKLVGMARAPIAAAMVGKTIGRTIEENEVPVYIERFGSSKEEIFVTAAALRRELGDEQFEKLPTGALGLYTYYERLDQGLRQLMAGSRKFSLEHLSRDDIAALTPEAAQVSGIRYIMDVDQGKVESILDG
jgi:glutamate synthase domain-containing protein 2